MKKIFVLFLFTASFIFANNLSVLVESLDEQMENTFITVSRIRISNNGETLHNVKIKYFIQNDSSIYTPYYIPNGIIAVEEFSANWKSITIEIDSLPKGIYPDSAGISFGIHFTNWTQRKKKDDFSYPKENFFTTTNKISIYVKDSLIYGKEPEKKQNLIISAIQPEKSLFSVPWLEIKNIGETSEYLNDYSLIDFDGKEHHLFSFLLEKGESVRITLPEKKAFANCKYWKLCISIDTLNFRPTGFISLLKKQIIQQSINLTQNIFLSSNFELSTDTAYFAGPAIRYQPGYFFKANIINNFIASWELKKSKDIFLYNSSISYADPLSLSENSIIALDLHDSLTLAWTQEPNATCYKLRIYNYLDSSLIYETITTHLSHRVFLPPGNYLWDVIAIKESLYGKSVDSFETLNKLNVVSLNNFSTLYDLNVQALAARKDSYLLDLKWGEKILEKRWDQPHNSSAYLDSANQLQFSDPMQQYPDAEELWRCWVVGTTMLNHYYGGNLTQDEIKFHSKVLVRDSILEAFRHHQLGAGFKNNIDTALTWALQISPNNLNYINRKPTELEILEALKKQKPVYISTNSHIMVIDAAKRNDFSNQIAFRFLNVDNNGHFQWLIYENETNIIQAWIPSNINSPRLQSSLMVDSDNDGIMDFDEILRFHTNPHNKDSDGDGVEDKIEIMSYTIREPYPLPKYNPVYQITTDYGVVKESFADIDHDNTRSELDPDSDNGGIIDGSEDFNQNGKIDINETDPLNNNDDFSKVEPLAYEMPPGFTLYALDSLNIHDGVKCSLYDSNDFCQVASSSTRNNYAILIGARAHIGNTFSRGGVLMRSAAEIHGKLYLIQTAKLANIYKQNGAIIQDTIISINDSIWQHTLPLHYKLPLYPTYSENNKVVRSNEILNITPLDSFSTVKVESGGKLIFSSGNLWIKNLQLEPGSTLKFESPNQNTFLHLNGSITWRGTIENSDLITIAKNFKLIQYSNRKMYIDALWVGNILAPYSTVIMGQSNKNIFGSIAAKNILIHQYSKIIGLEFQDKTSAIIVKQME